MAVALREGNAELRIAAIANDQRLLRIHKQMVENRPKTIRVAN